MPALNATRPRVRPAGPKSGQGGGRATGSEIVVRVQYGAERASVYAEGGIAYDRHMPRIGWVACDDPGPTVVELAEAAHAAFRAIHRRPAPADA
jgi:hypothetical protein